MISCALPVSICPRDSPGELIGRGRLGDTWAARGQDGRALVLKRLAGLAPAAKAATELFTRMVVVPACVTPMALEAVSGDLWLAYPQVDGSLAVAAARSHGAGVCDSVRETFVELHGAGLVHGAVSDSHVLVTPTGDVRLLEVGLATLGVLDPVTRDDDLRQLAVLLDQMAAAASRAGAGVVESAASAARRSNPVTAPTRRRPVARAVALAVALAVLALVAVVAVGAVGALLVGLPAARGAMGANLPVARPAAISVGGECTQVTLPDLGSASYWAVDMSGSGCAEPLAWAGGVVVTASPAGALLRFTVGQPGDVLLVGHWSCSRVDLPALYRPGTGELFLLHRWPRDGQAVESDPAVGTGIRNGTPRTVGTGRCQHVEVRRR